MTNEEPSVYREKSQKAAIFDALNGIFQLPQDQREAEFLKAARLMVEKGFGKVCEEFVLGGRGKFQGNKGAQILAKVEEMIRGANPIQQIHEARTSEIRFKGPGLVDVKAAEPRLKVVRSG